MRPSDRDLQQLGPFPGGANNVSRETSVPSRSVRAAHNVVQSDDGKYRRREGYELVEEFAHASSLFAAGRRGFVLDGDTLYTFEVHAGAISGLVPVASGLRPGARLASALIEPDLFVSDNDQNLRIGPTGTVTPWTIAEAPAPAVAVSTGGSLSAGRYLVTVAHASAAREEGPPSESVVIDVPENGALQIGLPAPLPHAPRFAVYMTKPNGVEPLLVDLTPAGVVSLTVSNDRLGRPCPNEGTEPLPPAEFALYWRSRLWVASGHYLTASEPFQYALCRLDESTMTFSEEITGLAATGEAGAGIFIGQESKVYYARGDRPGALSLDEKYPAGMVAGTLTMVPGARLPLEAPPTEPVPMWLATNGVVCAGLPDGTVLPLTETRFAADVGSTGAGMFMQKDGESRFVATTAEPSENGFAVRDEAIFEVVRNGIPHVV